MNKLWTRFKSYWNGDDIKPRDRWHTLSIAGKAIVVFFRRGTVALLVLSIIFIVLAVVLGGK